jgi:hypothetical protein
MSEPDSWVYAIGPVGSSVVKIGLAGNVTSRLRTLQTAHYQLLAVRWKGPGDHDLEQEIHARLAPFRLRGEWFDFAQADPVSLICAAIEEIHRDGGARRAWNARKKDGRRKRAKSARTALPALQ